MIPMDTCPKIGITASNRKANRFFLIVTGKLARRFPNRQIHEIQLGVSVFDG